MHTFLLPHTHTTNSQLTFCRPLIDLYDDFADTYYAAATATTPLHASPFGGRPSQYIRHAASTRPHFV